MRIKVTWIFVVGFASLLAWGCQTAAEKSAAQGPWARFYIESSNPAAVQAVLPLSEVQLKVGPKPVLTEFDIVNVEIAKVDLGRCLLFQVNPAAARDLYRMSVVNQGRRLVLVIDGKAMGVRRIDGPIADGNLLIFVEVPDSVLPELQTKLKQSAAAIKKKTE